MIERREGRLLVHVCIPIHILEKVVEHIGDSPFEFIHFRNAIEVTVKPDRVSNSLEKSIYLMNAEDILREKIIGARYGLYLYELYNVKYDMLDIIIPDMLRLNNNEFILVPVKGQYILSPLAKSSHVMNNRHHYQYWNNHVLTTNPNELLLLAIEVTAYLYVHKYSDFNSKVDFIKTSLVQMLPEKLKELVIKMIEQLDNAQEFR